MLELIAKLEEMFRKTTQGEWYHENTQDKPNRGAYETAFAPSGETLFGTENSSAAEIHESAGSESVHYWDQTGKSNLEFCCEIHNRFLDLTADLKARLSDPRIGVSVRQLWEEHITKYETGIVIDVAPSGTFGIWDQQGVLKLRMPSGLITLVPASAWAPVKDVEGRMSIS